MKVVHLSAQADSDGVVRLTIPACNIGGQYAVTVVMEPVSPSNPSHEAPTPDELGWPPGYFERTYGSIDDETFVAPPRPRPEPVEAIE